MTVWLLLAIGWVLGALTVGAFVWASAHKERLAFEAGERRIAAAEAKRDEHMRALREHEDEMLWAAIDHDAGLEPLP